MNKSMKTPGRYVRPTLERYGTFRELTRTGLFGAADGGLILNPDDDTPSPAGDGSGGSPWL